MLHEEIDAPVGVASVKAFNEVHEGFVRSGTEGEGDLAVDEVES